MLWSKDGAEGRMMSVMNDLIYRKDVIEDYIAGFGLTLEDIEKIPAVEVELVKHGRWIYNGRFCELNRHKCSVCGKDEFRMSDYCPNCGAHMIDEVLEDE